MAWEARSRLKLFLPCRTVRRCNFTRNLATPRSITWVWHPFGESSSVRKKKGCGWCSKKEGFSSAMVLLGRSLELMGLKSLERTLQRFGSRRNASSSARVPKFTGPQERPKKCFWFRDLVRGHVRPADGATETLRGHTSCV